jgi:aminoglycoside phosphotransferase (APT) family kinase protein
MTDPSAPGPVLARGEDADVFAIDETRVLRRYRRRAVPQREVAIMRYVRDRGYPVPLVFDLSGSDLTLERIDGRTMLADLRRRPWRMRAHALTLSRLHRALHAIPPPDFLGAEGAAILHLDLHPENVMVAPGGPVVIDWANAARGDPAFRRRAHRGRTRRGASRAAPLVAARSIRARFSTSSRLRSGAWVSTGRSRTEEPMATSVTTRRSG